MIAKPFYLLKKILFIIKSKEKILFTTNLKQPNQTTKAKNPFFIATPYSNNLISFKMTFIGLMFV
ncbi:hypothetical protein AM498_03495 [Helicobacter pylori]|nr:hypothetical protein AM498_03495 [Helicobacter pylori]